MSLSSMNPFTYKNNIPEIKQIIPNNQNIIRRSKYSQRIFTQTPIVRLN